MTAMTWRRTAIICLTATLALTACTDKTPKQPEGQQVQIIAGGGTNPNATKAVDADLVGDVVDVEVGSDGTLRLLIDDRGDGSIWVIKPSGESHRIVLDPSVTTASQLAVAPDGTMYVSHPVRGAGSISKISPDGKSTIVVGNGKVGNSRDGELATGPALNTRGITIDHEGRLVYGESGYFSDQQPSGSVLALIRRVERNGRIRTIAGRPDPVPDHTEAIVRSVAPPPGTKALEWTLAGSAHTDSLATGDDGTIFSAAPLGVLAVAPDGSIRAVARRRDPAAAPPADRPFVREGDAADAAPYFLPKAGLTEDGGWVTLPVADLQGNVADHLPPAFRWTGSYTASQQKIIDSAVREAESAQTPTLRLVQPDGSVTTAAWGTVNGAVSGSRVYLVLTDDVKRSLIGSISLPS